MTKGVEFCFSKQVASHSRTIVTQLHSSEILLLNLLNPGQNQTKQLKYSPTCRLISSLMLSCVSGSAGMVAIFDQRRGFVTCFRVTFPKNSWTCVKNTYRTRLLIWKEGHGRWELWLGWFLHIICTCEAQHLSPEMQQPSITYKYTEWVWIGKDLYDHLFLTSLL